MIPKDKYILMQDVGHIITDDLFLQYHTQEEFNIFQQWMRGQTGCIMEGGGFGIYSWDYERWMRQGMKKSQGSDWD